ncbi:WbqC family protein [Tateyamaria sp. syn59]|uniref:WbqC family protein n=1 Tax=Tateyamaria sp. syn59 TaxID=2576942 RepID=UPI0011BED637|nr:WbqC family protein [Tateyamaria sp. syn59]
MRAAIMQPYLLPYIGYFQLIAHADTFVIYDDIQFSKKGWINRNRFLRNGDAVMFTLPLRKDSDYLDVRDRNIADAYDPKKLIAQIENAYRKAPQFATAMPVIEEILGCSERNLFTFIHHSVTRVCTCLGLDTPIIVSSSLGDTTGLKGQDRVLAICEAVSATSYVNPIGGLDLYQASAFQARGMDLHFMRRTSLAYEQFGHPFVPDLSILDIMMFNSVDEARSLITDHYEMVAPKDD